MSSSTNHQRYPRTSCANCQADYRLLNEAAAKSSLLDLTVGQLERLRTIYATRPEKLTQALAEQLKSEVVEVTIIAEEWRITRYLAFRNGRFGDLIRQFAASNRIEDHRSVLF